jgi:hypothetical protein
MSTKNIKWNDKKINYIILFFLLITTVYLICNIFNYTNYSYDFTDEGFYLSQIKDPYLTKWEASYFGNIYNPIYVFFKGNIPSLRKINVVITYSLALFLSWSLLEKFFKTEICSVFIRLCLSSSLAVLALTNLINHSWLSTPSYDSLTFQSILLMAIGLVTVGTSKKIDFKSYFVLSLGLSLATLAKPTSGLGIFVLTILFLNLEEKLNFKGTCLFLLMSFFTFNLILFLMDLTIFKYIKNMSYYFNVIKYEGTAHNLLGSLRIDTFNLNKYGYSIFVFLSLIYLYINRFYTEKITKRAILAIGFIGTISIFYFISCGNRGLTHDFLNEFKILILIFIPFSILISRFFLKKNDVLDFKNLSLASIFFTLPHVVAFGTLNNYWQSGSSAAIFWVFSGLLLLPKSSQKNTLGLLLIITLMTQFLFSLFLSQAVMKPYRNGQSIKNSNIVTKIGSDNSFVNISQEYAAFIEEIIKKSNLAGFHGNEFIIDMSGQSPGVLYALNAKNLGRAWIVGGMPGSDRVTLESLKLVSCKDLAHSWILYEPGGPRSISIDVLNYFNINLLLDYKIEATWFTPIGFGESSYNRMQHLLKPKNLDYLKMKNCLV